MLAILSLLAPLAAAKTIHVPTDYSKIQEAIDAALDGDVVLVGPNTYEENIDFKGKAIIVRSEEGPEVTLIDGGHSSTSHYSCAYFRNGEGPDSVLDGFTLMNGKGTPWAYGRHGGGIFCKDSSPSILNNIIRDNTAYEVFSEWGHGGGIYCQNGSPLIAYNEIHSNESDSYGGGICCLGPSSTIIHNRIHDNYSENGGGIYVDGNDNEVSFNHIYQNQAYSSDYTVSGGGICCDGVTRIQCNVIRDNEAGKYGPGGNGGGIFCSGDTEIKNNVLAGNKAYYGALFYSGEGGGISCQVSTRVVNNTIYANGSEEYGGGICCRGDVHIVNTILWYNDNTYGFADELCVYTGTTTILYSDVRGGNVSPYVHVEPGATLNWGPGMIDGDPLFVNDAGWDLHLTYTSPCKDAGDNSASGLPSEDFEGDPRIAYGTVDMGADEFHTHLYYVGDATPGGQVGLNFVGDPNDPILLFVGSGVLDPPWPTKYGDWYLLFPLLFQGGFGTVPSNGVASVLIWISSGTPAPWDIPMQAGIGMELTNLRDGGEMKWILREFASAHSRDLHPL